MKKVLLTSALLGFVASTFAQGYLNYGNGSTTTVSTNNTQNYLGQSLGGTASGVTSGSGVAPQGYYYALLYQSYSGTTAANNITSLASEGWSFGGIYATNALAGGRFTGGTDVAVNGTTAGGNYQFVVVGWSASETSLGSGGPNWSTIASDLTTGNWADLNGYVGVSSVGIINGIAGQPPATASSLFGASPGIVSPFTLYSVSVPEPGTMALAALGGASLLLFRRKK